MIVSDLNETPGKTYPARRWTRNLVGGAAPIQASNFCLGYVVLEPSGGQVPWHNQEQEEVYFVLEGTGEMCLGEERQTVTSGQAVYIPHGVFHQLTNIGDTPLTMMYCYGPAALMAERKRWTTERQMVDLEGLTGLDDLERRLSEARASERTARITAVAGLTGANWNQDVEEERAGLRVLSAEHEEWRGQVVRTDEETVYMSLFADVTA